MSQDAFPKPETTTGVNAEVLAIDLDGTLIRTDTLHESILLAVRRKPSSLLKMPGWIAQGKAQLKAHVADIAVPDASLLPYRESVLRLIREFRATHPAGKVVLATACDRRIADAVASYLNLFDHVVASDGTSNCSGTHKIEALRAFAGTRRLAYLGDASVDAAVWQGCDECLLLDTGRGIQKRFPQLRFSSVLQERGVTARALSRAMRPHQWAKNVLIFLPLIAAHRWMDLRLVVLAILALIAFCFAASAVYVMNDLLDLEPDRRHARKRRRPFASGELPAHTGIQLGVGFAVLALATASFVSLPFVAWLLVYAITTSAYSLFLKSRLLVDVITLAGLYCLRVLAGGIAVGIFPSPWLISLSMFLFTSLAFAKRYAELFVKQQAEGGALPGRSYMPTDMPIIASVGASCGVISVLVLALYVNGPASAELYRAPELLWLVSPLLLYWISRVWFFACRGVLNEDPVVFALKDRISQIVGVLVGVIFIAAAAGPQLITHPLTAIPVTPSPTTQSAR